MDDDDLVRVRRFGVGDSTVSYLHCAECALQRSQGCSPLHFVLRRRQTTQALATRKRLKPYSAASADDMVRSQLEGQRGMCCRRQRGYREMTGIESRCKHLL